MAIPKLRFQSASSPFPDWEPRTFRSLGEFIRGLTYSGRDVCDYGNGVLVVRSSNIVGDWFVNVDLDLQFVSVKDFPALQAGDVVICTANGSVGLVGKTAIYKGDSKFPVSFGAFCAVFRGKDALAKYIFRTARYKKLIQKHKQGGNGALGNLNVGVLCVESVFYPSDEDEIRKISLFLWNIDEKIQLSGGKLAALEKLKAGLMQKIFSRELRFKREDGTDFENWEKFPLGDLAILKNGISKSKDFFGYGSSFINLNDVFGKAEIASNPLGKVFVTQGELSEFQVIKGDVLFVRSSVKKNGVGLPCLVSKNIEDTVFSGFLIRCRFLSNKIIDGFKKYCFLESDFRNDLLSKCTTSANTNIGQDALSLIKVKTPSIEEQRKIVEVLELVDKKISLSQKRIYILKKQKKAFMQKMFV